MKDLLFRAFDLITDLVLSDGGDGTGWILVNEDMYSTAVSFFTEWKKTSKIKDWDETVMDMPFVAYIAINSREETVSITSCLDAPSKEFGDHYIRI